MSLKNESLHTIITFLHTTHNDFRQNPIKIMDYSKAFDLFGESMDRIGMSSHTGTNISVFLFQFFHINSCVRRGFKWECTPGLNQPYKACRSGLKLKSIFYKNILAKSFHTHFLPKLPPYTCKQKRSKFRQILLFRC